MEAAKRLEDHGISVGWNVFLSKANINDVEEMIGVLRSLTADVDPFINVTVPTWKPNRRLMEYEPLRLDVYELEAAIQGISGNVASPDVLCEGAVTQDVLTGAHDLAEMERDFSAYRRQGGYVSVTCDRQLNVYEGSRQLRVLPWQSCIRGHSASDGKHSPLSPGSSAANRPTVFSLR